MICLLLSLPFKATEMKQYAFQQIINIQNGLSSSVRCLTVSHEKGYVWVGTRTGIGRFDGYELKKYLHDNITHLFEDNENKIWAVTAKGLYYYNESDDNFLQAKDKEQHPLSAASSVHGQTEFYLADTERFINTTMLTGKRNCFAPCNPTITIISLPCENGTNTHCLP